MGVGEWVDVGGVGVGDVSVRDVGVCGCGMWVCMAYGIWVCDMWVRGCVACGYTCGCTDIPTTPNTPQIPPNTPQIPPPHQVIAATNRADILDPALMRSGRLDRKIEFPHPSEDARAKILQVCVCFCVCFLRGKFCCCFCFARVCVYGWMDVVYVRYTNHLVHASLLYIPCTYTCLCTIYLYVHHVPPRAHHRSIPAR